MQIQNKIKWLFVIISPLILQGCTTSKDQTNVPEVGVQPSSANDDVPTDSVDLELEASLQYANDQYEMALTSYLRLLERDTTNGEFFYRVGYLLMQLNRHSEAIGYFTKSASRGYKVFDSYKNIGMIHSIVLNDDAKGIEYLNKCLEIDPNAGEVKKLIKSMKEDLAKKPADESI